MENEIVINDVNSELLAEAKKALRANDFDLSRTKFNEVLSIDPDNIEARFGILNTNTKTRNMDELLEYYENLYSSPAYESIKACEPDVSRIEKNVEKFYIPGYLEKDEIRSICKYNNFEYQSCLKQRQKQRQQIENEIRKDEDLSFLYNHKDNEISSSFFNRLKAAYDKRTYEAENEDNKNSVLISSNYQKYLLSKFNELSDVYRERLTKREKAYKEITNDLSDNLMLEEYKRYLDELSKMLDYKDSPKFVSFCKKKIEEIERKHQWNPVTKAIDDSFASARKYLKI